VASQAAEKSPEEEIKAGILGAVSKRNSVF
jgi:hypothetical protein